MAKKKKTTRDREWADAKRKCRLNAETVRMAKELGMNPRKLIKNIPSKTERWKAPVHIWIRDLYEKRLAKTQRKQRNKAEETGDGRPAAGGNPPATHEHTSTGTPSQHDTHQEDHLPPPDFLEETEYPLFELYERNLPSEDSSYENDIPF